VTRIVLAPRSRIQDALNGLTAIRSLAPTCVSLADAVERELRNIDEQLTTANEEIWRQNNVIEECSTRITELEGLL
jgi:hypothetical protein